MMCEPRQGLTAVFVVVLLLSACGVPPSINYYRLSDTGVQPAFHEMSSLYTDYFGDRYSLVVLVDTSPCGKALQETVCWSDWRDHAYQLGLGFVYVTSRADSFDVAYAAMLDSASAPVLVAPGCEKYVSELGIPRGGLPLKLMIDSAGTIVKAWDPVTDTSLCRVLMAVVDSLVYQADSIVAGSLPETK
jgi:hypothetical protein